MGKITKTNCIHTIFLVYLMMLISGASFLANNDVLVLLCFVVIVFITGKKIKLFDNIVVILFIWWTVINVLSALVMYNFSHFNFYSYLGLLVRILTSYYILKYMGTCFWEKFESFLFILTCVALPVFVLSIFFPSFFHSLSSVFQILTYKSLYVFKESQANYWYSFFFVFDGRNSGRNCGFMWEPGAFAMILTIAIIYNFLKNGVQMNRHIVIYTIAILTTFSTLGYIALGVLLLLFLIEANNLIYRLCIIGILLYSIVVLIPTVDFLGEKINEYIEETQNKVAYPQNLQESESEKYEVNRLYTFILNFQKTLLIPTGYGATEDTISNMAKQDLVGINGLGAIMVSWGFLGLLVAFISIYKFCSLYEKEHTFIFPALCTIAVCIVFFSNPIDRNPIFFLIVLTPYCLR